MKIDMRDKRNNETTADQTENNQASHHMSRELRGVIDQDGISAQGVCIIASTRDRFFGEICNPNK